MNPKELMAFIQRIISTSPDQRAAQQALKQLMEILTASGESSGELMIKTALTGVGDDFGTMGRELTQDSDPEALINAVQHAEQARIQREAAERNGRC